MHLFYELRERLRRWFGQGWRKNAKLRKALLGVLFFALLLLILSGQMAPQRLDVNIGDPAPFDVLAPKDVVDRITSENRRILARNVSPKVTKINPKVLAQAREHIQLIFNRTQTVRDLPNQDEQTKVNLLVADFGLANTVPPETYAALLQLSDQALQTARQDAVDLAEEALEGRVEPLQIADIQAKIDQDALNVTIQSREPRIRQFIKALVKSRIRATVEEDHEETERLRERAAKLEPVVIRRGEPIIERRQPVTEEQYEVLKELGMIGTQADFRSWFGTALLSLVCVSVIGLYLYRHRPDILQQDSKLLLLGLIGLSTLLLVLLMKTFEDRLGPSVAYLMPIAFNSMLVAILLDPKVALLQSTVLALLTGLMSSVDQIQYALVAAVGGFAGAFFVSRIESRTAIYRAGALVSLANAVTIFSIYFMRVQLNIEMWKSVGLGVANGLIVAVLVTGALPMFENLFGIVTPLKLLELSNPNHPLLKKLLVEAPGSYHHTILVANLCEGAAEAIGADQVLARVGAYYHDIGKTKRPYFFVENQYGGENPHDKLPPSLSALIITSHVKDGLEMAKEAGLPQEIVDFIPEHHGTTLVSYFYHMASKSGQAEYVLEEDFRYEGPKPQCKETALCMLADGCEASVRAMRQKGPLTVELLEVQVKRIIDDRLQQGQLENCDLTFRDLDTIAKTFVRILGGVHHARIDYPPEVQGRLAAEAVSEKSTDAASQPAEGENHGDLDRQRAESGSGQSGAGGDDPERPGEGPGS
jgi:putative nucleotidyltransferase with HDIG domain